MAGILSAFGRTGRKLGSEYRRSASVLSFNHDGLEIARVKTERKFLPLWHVAVFLYLVLLIRLIVMSDIGPATYSHRIENMKNGNILEQITARAMYMDPISRSIAFEVRSALNNLGFH